MFLGDGFLRSLGRVKVKLLEKDIDEKNISGVLEIV